MTAKERVIQERAELIERLEKLKAFLKSSRVLQLSSSEYSLLVSQESVMEQYKTILDNRLEIWRDTDV